MTRTSLYFQIFVCLFYATAAMHPGKADAFPKTRDDFALLPEYCSVRYAGQFGLVASNAEVQKWKKVFGRDWVPIHHYCSALDHINKSRRFVGNEEVRRQELGLALGGLDYMLGNTHKDFILLPEILVKKGEVLLELNRGPEGVKQFTRAIQVRRSYAPAYIALSEYYRRQGEVAEAKRVLEQGIKSSRQSRALKESLGRLDGGVEDAKEMPATGK
jgi:tetratricopeptide (TPR) repeat protein